MSAERDAQVDAMVQEVDDINVALDHYRAKDGRLSKDPGLIHSSAPMVARKAALLHLIEIGPQTARAD